MTAGRWRRIEEVYHAALEVAPRERDSFIAQACQGDEALRKEICDLIERNGSSVANLLDTPVWGAGQSQPAVGTRLGPYEIVAQIGAGGMGQVFRARDTRLNRSVAIKTAAAHFSDRFTREAHAIAALNHPNICTLYDVGPNFLVMELIEGPTLDDRNRKGALPLAEALDIARQIARALEAAHEKGIVHRDLKPANIKFAADGSVKVLDFGLAKSQEAAAAAADTVTMTASGMILGTVGYMSPEQARGQEVDKRADIWAFGVVLYEMLTGMRPFEGATMADALAAVLEREPDLTKVPRRVRRLLGRCLQKDPRKRLRDIGDWEELLDSGEAPSTLRKGVRAGATAAAALLVAIATGAGALWWKLSVPERTTRFELALPESVQFDEYVSVSPDGRKVVFNATGEQSGLWIHDLSNLSWRRLEGTGGARSPFWSPDGRALGFAVDRELKRIEVTGGPAQTICTAPGPVGMGAWSRDGVIVFGGQGIGPMRRVAATGGVATDLTAVVGSGHGGNFDNFPVFLPDGKHFLYLRSGAPEVQGVYAGSVDAQPGTQSKQRIVATFTASLYVDGKLLFLRDGTLLAQRFDADKLALRGDPVAVSEHVSVIRHYSVFSASTAVLTYRTGADSSGRDELSWFDRQGKKGEAVGEPSVWPSISPDGTRVAVRDAELFSKGDLWLVDFSTGARTRFTFHQSPGSRAVWAPDGKRIVFSTGVSADTILEKAADGSGAEVELFREPGTTHVPSSISPDRRFLLYSIESTSHMGQLWLLRLDGGRRAVRLLGAEFNRKDGVFSPDGRWVAYLSDESGRGEIYVRPFVPSGPSLGESQWQVSTDGAAMLPPKWRKDGNELYYLNSKDIMEAVEVDGSRAAFQAGSPRPLLTTQCSCGWDVTPDGNRFLVHHSKGMGGHTPITVVLNWQAELKQ